MGNMMTYAMAHFIELYIFCCMGNELIFQVMKLLEKNSKIFSIMDNFRVEMLGMLLMNVDGILISMNLVDTPC